MYMSMDIENGTGGDRIDVSKWLVYFRMAGYDPSRAWELYTAGAEVPRMELARRESSLIENDSVRVVCEGDEDYPAGLDGCLGDGRPRVLFHAGDISMLGTPSVFICGTRDASRAGRETAYKCARLAAEAGCTVISGYARGIDSAAHLGALEGGGKTAAVLPYGLAHFSVRRMLAAAFEPDDFLAVSEMPPFTGFTVKAALRRNALLAALADVVIVIEPGETGGTWHSARKARAMGKPLFFHEGARPEAVGRMLSLGGERIEMRSGAPLLGKVLEMCGR